MDREQTFLNIQSCTNCRRKVLPSLSVFQSCIVTPLLVKVTLVLWNYYHRQFDDHDELYRATNRHLYRIKYPKGFLIGCCLFHLGLTCHQRLFELGQEFYSLIFVRFRLVGKGLYGRAVNKNMMGALVVFLYYVTTLHVLWPQFSFNYSRMIIFSGWYSELMVIIALACLLFCFTLGLSSLWNSDEFGSSSTQRWYSLHMGKFGLIVLLFVPIYVKLLFAYSYGLISFLLLVTSFGLILQCLLAWLLVRNFNYNRSFNFRPWFIQFLSATIPIVLAIVPVGFIIILSFDCVRPNLSDFFFFTAYVSAAINVVVWDFNVNLIKSSLNGVRLVETSVEDYRDNSVLICQPCSIGKHRFERIELAHRFNLLICGLVTLLILAINQFSTLDSQFIGVCELGSFYTMNVFLFVQLIVGYPQKWIIEPNNQFVTPICKLSKISQTYMEFAFLSIVNLSILGSVILAYYWCSSTISMEYQVYFIPCIFFCLHGRHYKFYRTPSALAAFTILLLTILFQTSPLLHPYIPPTLPKFDRKLFTISSSSSSSLQSTEAVLILSLIPIHALFLADQINLKFDWFIPAGFRDHYVCLLLAKYFSYTCLTIFNSAYVLMLGCLAFWFVASSFVSALYGLYSFAVCFYVLLRVNIVIQSSRDGVYRLN